MSEQPRHCIVAIVPCNDIEASTAFYGRLGLSLHSDHDGTLVRIGWPSRLLAKGHPSEPNRWVGLNGSESDD
jgi:catechol 2,3-dioxygenase-like lactoylglutathione lyase family enzyme